MRAKDACACVDEILDIFKDKKHEIQLEYIRPIIMLYFVLVLYTLLLRQLWHHNFQISGVGGGIAEHKTRGGEMLPTLTQF